MSDTATVSATVTESAILVFMREAGYATVQEAIDAMNDCEGPLEEELRASAFPSPQYSSCQDSDADTLASVPELTRVHVSTKMSDTLVMSAVTCTSSVENVAAKLENTLLPLPKK